MSPTRAAEVRPVSMTQTSRRSRSGRQVRTTTVLRRAVARQSIERTSSPSTYSRSASNSVPWPRPRTASEPSSCRSRDNFSGRNRRDVNGGSTRTVHGGVSRSALRRQGRPVVGQAERTVGADRHPGRRPITAPGRRQHGLFPRLDFADRHGVTLDRIYVAKMMFGLLSLVERGSIAPGSTVVAVITGP